MAASPYKQANLEHYVACMVLSGVGDALGYRNGRWEFCKSGPTIHEELAKLGGVEKIKVSLPGWKVSDDTVMHLATAEALIDKQNCENKEEVYRKLVEKYQDCMNDMTGRAPGQTCQNVYFLQPDQPNGYCQPFNYHGGGCGAAMRTMCIGLRYPRAEQLDDLIAVSIEAGRVSHHNPTGYLGSFTTALFTSYAIQRKPLPSWGASLMSELPKAMEYIESQGRYVAENKETWGYFEDRWRQYLKLREISAGKSDPVFPEKYGVEERDDFYTSLSYHGWGGASGHDAPMIAYDALMGAQDSWVELCNRGVFHCGDSDSTGTMAAAWYGALYGFKDVPSCNHKSLEYRDRLEKLGEQFYDLNKPDNVAHVTLEDETCTTAL